MKSHTKRKAITSLVFMLCSFWQTKSYAQQPQATQRMKQEESASTSKPLSQTKESQDKLGGSYSSGQIEKDASVFFGKQSKDLSASINKIFAEYGDPMAYIDGSEGSGAFFVGARYGNGYMHLPDGRLYKIYWHGPSIGLDFGANGTKVFSLIYGLEGLGDIYQRIPGMNGGVFVIGGYGVTFQRLGNVVVATVRSGVGLKLGASVGYTDYSKDPKWWPF